MGLEIQPGVPQRQQAPALKIVAWETPDSTDATPKGVRASFIQQFGPCPDRLRYIGRWIPTTGTVTSGGGTFDFGEAYNACVTQNLTGFNQIVFRQ